MTDLDERYLSRPDIYREACRPRPDLDEYFVESLRFRIIQDDPGYWDKERDNHSCMNWCVALRTAISEAWDSYREAEYVRQHPDDMGEISQSYAHGQRYTAMRVIRGIAREMYRETVPHEERIL